MRAEEEREAFFSTCLRQPSPLRSRRTEESLVRRLWRRRKLPGERRTVKKRYFCKTVTIVTVQSSKSHKHKESGDSIAEYVVL
jgi:hypothetical protein